MLNLDGLRNVMNQQGLSRQSIDSSDSNSSCVSSPGSVSYPPVHPTSTPTHGEIRPGVMLPWTQGGGVYPPPPPENSDEEDEYRPFTPPPPRERLSYTRYQLELLNAIYGTVKYPNSTQKQLIAKRVGITRDQVKIWFQNRRRKDVVGKQDKVGKDEKETESPESVKPDSANAEKTTSNKDDSKSEKTEEDPDETVLPVMVMKSVIAELKRFEKDPLKNKNKKKSRKRPATSQAVGPKPPQPLFQAYDMISPPNRVTPSAFSSAAPSRFHHSKASSAFHNPRDAKHPSQMMFPGQSYLHGIHPPPSASSISVFPNDYVNPPNTTAPPPSASHNGGHSLYESIPVLADLLGYRTHVDVARQREHVLHQPHVPTHCATSGRSPENPASDTTSPPTHSAIGLNRVFPFPFIADPPVMLSSIRPSDTYRPQLHYQPPSYSEDPYQPLVISSLSNPYYSSTSPAAWSTSQSHADSSVTSSSYAH